MNSAQRDINRKLRIFEHAQATGNVSKTCRYFGISRTAFYEWKKAYKENGEPGLVNQKPCPRNPKLRTPPEVEEKILYLRRKYHLGQLRISWYLKRYHGISVSSGGVWNVLKRNGINRLPRNTRKRAVSTHRYEKQVPGHHIQVDVKFLKFKDSKGKPIKRYQYTAVDDATRIRALKVYERHTQVNAIHFIDHVIEKFPFRIHTVRTDNGHEFQAKFHWHLHDIGINHDYIKPASPHLNGKVERSHSTDEQEFYQLLSYTDDVDLKKKLAVWEDFYNLWRPHSSKNGKTPYEVLSEKMKKAA
jgi:transposase InsO family protein